MGNSAARPEPATFADQPKTFQVRICNLCGNTVMVIAGVESGHRVRQLKYKIRDRIGVHPSAQRLYFGGKLLEDDETLASYNIRKDDSVHLVVRIRGGMKRDLGLCSLA